MAILNIQDGGIVVMCSLFYFVSLANVCLSGKIMTLDQRKNEILKNTFFFEAAILNIQDGGFMVMCSLFYFVSLTSSSLNMYA